MRESLKLPTTVKFQNYIAIVLIYVVLPISTSLQHFPQRCLTHSHQVPFISQGLLNTCVYHTLP